MTNFLTNTKIFSVDIQMEFRPKKCERLAIQKIQKPTKRLQFDNRKRSKNPENQENVQVKVKTKVNEQVLKSNLNLNKRGVTDWTANSINEDQLIRRKIRN